MTTEWVTLKLPKTLVDQIDKIVGKQGYTSRTDVASEAIRDFLKKFQEENIVYAKR
jgi:metal-responsive CopG/Arc/MetJ family transcriptional regulator